MGSSLGLRPLRRKDWHLMLASFGLLVAGPTTAGLAFGSVIVFLGMMVRFIAAGFLEKEGPQLTTDGPYRYVRHPLYLGSTMAAMGFAIMTSRVSSAVLLGLAFLALYVKQVLNEERGLLKRYGLEYTEYRRGVPRFVPRSRPAATGKGWRWEGRRFADNKESRRIGYALLLCLLFVMQPYWMSALLAWVHSQGPRWLTFLLRG